MKLALAQVNSQIGNLELNIQRHVDLIELAIASQIDAIFFPELSITGYDPNIANKFALDPNDRRFQIFEKLSVDHKVIIGFGSPSKGSEKERISMFLFHPDKMKSIYSKQFLYKDEVPFFESGEEYKFISFEKEKISLAICYESLVDKHINAASQNGSTIYLASVAKSQSGTVRVASQYSSIASSHDMTVLMVNGVGDGDGFVNGGSSSIWDRNGNNVIQLGTSEEAVIIWDTITETAKSIPLNIIV